MWTALPLWVLAYLLGVLGGQAAGFAPQRPGWLLLCAAAPLWLLWRRWPGCALLALTLIVGALAQAPRPPPEVPESGLFAGRIEAPPVELAEGARVRVALQAVREEGGGSRWRRIHPPLLVAVRVLGAPREPLWSGDAVWLQARLLEAEPGAYPGAPDGARRAAAQGLHRTALVAPDALLRVDGAPQGPRQQLLRRLQALRQRLSENLAASLQGEAHALVAALVLGERGPLLRLDQLRRDRGEAPLTERFRQAGVVHLLSVSGSHLAVVVLLIFRGMDALLRRVPVLVSRFPPRRLAALCAVPVALLYTLLTGAEVATVRALVVAVLYLLAIACGHRASLLTSVAGAVLLIANPFSAPLAIYDPALQLSLCATLGCAYLQPLPALPEPLPGEPLDRVARAARRGLRLLQMSAGATLATAPLTALHFSQVDGAGVVGNLVAVPLGEVLLIPAGLTGAVVSLWLPELGRPLLQLAGAAAQVLIALVEAIAGWGCFASVPVPSVLALLLWALGLLLLAGRCRLWSLVLAGSLGVFLYGWWAPPGRLLASFMDVGQGDGAVLELPRGEVVVVDAGSERPISAYLRRRGHRRIDLLVVSHGHPDHTSGVPALLREFSVGRLWMIPEGGRERLQDPAWREALRLAHARAVPSGPIERLIMGEVRIEPIAPCDAHRGCGEAPVPTFGHNDNSLVLRVSYAGRALLLAGDLELPGELALLEAADQRRAAVRADVLKAPHHCSRTSSSESLLQAVAPAHVICSLGRHNRYGFPHQDVLERYHERGLTPWRTDQGGAVQVVVDPTGRLTVRDAAGREEAEPGRVSTGVPGRGGPTSKTGSTPVSFPNREG